MNTFAARWSTTLLTLVDTPFGAEEATVVSTQVHTRITAASVVCTHAVVVIHELMDRCMHDAMRNPRLCPPTHVRVCSASCRHAMG